MASSTPNAPQVKDDSGTSSDTGDKLAKNPLQGGPGGTPDATKGFKGVHDATAGDVSTLKGAELLKAAQAKAPNLSQEFVDSFKLDDDALRSIANGSVPPPPAIGPLHTVDLYLTPGGWQVTPPGVKPEDVGKNAIGNFR